MLHRTKPSKIHNPLFLEKGQRIYMDKGSSHSTDQTKAEVKLLAMLANELGFKLHSKVIPITKKSEIAIDGFSTEKRVLCEVYAHVGTLKPSQSDKVATDILKLNFAEKRLGGKWRKILLFHDEAACKQLKGLSWLAEVCRENSFEICVVDKNKKLKKMIVATQGRQMMVNAPGNKPIK